MLLDPPISIAVLDRDSDAVLAEYPIVAVGPTLHLVRRASPHRTLCGLPVSSGAPLDTLEALCLACEDTFALDTRPPAARP